MELKGEYRIPAPRDQVWAMLNDPDVLRECLPGCESLTGTPGEGFRARVTTKIGPVKATFEGSVSLTNVNPPQGYTISGEGKGGVAGFAKGGADVHLAEDGVGTVLTYVANAQVGGKLAQLGSRLIDSTAKKLADQFFACFAQKAGASAGSTVQAAEAQLGAAHLDAAGAGVAGTAADADPEPFILPGQPIPPFATGVPIVEGQAAEPETVRPVAPAPLGHNTTATASHNTDAITQRPHTIQDAAHEVEEEVERRAAMGFLGGPYVWGLLVLLVLLFIYVTAG